MNPSFYASPISVRPGIATTAADRLASSLTACSGEFFGGLSPAALHAAETMYAVALAAARRQVARDEARRAAAWRN